jgi:hypothetical protein
MSDLDDWRAGTAGLTGGSGRRQCPASRRLRHPQPAATSAAHPARRQHSPTRQDPAPGCVNLAWAQCDGLIWPRLRRPKAGYTGGAGLSWWHGSFGTAQQGIRHRGVDVSVGRPDLREAGIGTGCFVCCRAVVGCVRAVLAGAEVTEAAAVQVGVHRSTVHRLGRAVPDGPPGRVGGPVV